ncbi:B3 domain-containing protein Os06g0112300-like [Impatiens glandulifera]|uniref:B3 domain-containing protein Os06g0112300-like n=1 Tax=Impatiens glandulifera TaxID=253017 RepID=UPI001FB12E48|nr:B3 domain-containing protein Os06g0112300-like [Impatiens glandulifera]
MKEIMATEDVKISESNMIVESLVTDDKTVTNINESIQSFSEATMEMVQTLPLLGRPFFEVIIGQDNLAPFYQLDVPEEMNRFLPEDNVRAFLEHGGKRWKIVYYGSHKNKTRFNGNWKTFAIDNNLNLKDVCLFELMDESSSRCIIFRVEIQKGALPITVKQGNEAENLGKNVIIID